MMMFTDSTRGVNIAKDPAVVKYNGTYYMYYSLNPDFNHPESGWGIGIAQSDDLTDWNILGQLKAEGELESSGIEDDDGSVYLFYQGNNDGGRSWYLSNVKIDFKNGIPYIKFT